MGTDMLKTLILGTSYLAVGTEGAQNYPSKVVRLWAELAMKLNPGTDIAIVDSASPIDIFAALGGPRADMERLTIHQLGTNVGHINIGGKDGWGRALSAGIEAAMRGNYHYIAYIDCDNILTRPVEPIIANMDRCGVKVSSPLDTQYGFMENGIMFMNVAYLREIDFIGQYDWAARTRTSNPLDVPEMVTERIFGDDLWIHPMRTYRDDQNRLTVNNLAHMFPLGIDMLTHCVDPNVYLKLLEMKGITL